MALLTFSRKVQRLSLVRSRITGAIESRGEVLTFLDSHCEVNVKWLQPLLTRVRKVFHCIHFLCTDY